MKILVTCFEPFGGETINPAQEAVHRLPARVGECDIARADLPVEFGAAGDAALAAIARERPDAVVCVGQAGGRAKMTVERVAINVDDASAPDNAGACPVDQPISPNGPAAYFSTLPVKRMVAAMNEAGVPAAVSNTAGTYVCNHVLYRVLDALSGRAARAAFIHVPFIPEQAHDSLPSLPLDSIVLGLTAALSTCGEG